MTEINYTTAHEELDSSLVWDVWYDAVNRKAYVNLEDVVYAYSDVPAAAVNALVSAPSIGRHYNGSMFGAKGFKREFGPGARVGHLVDLTLRERTPVTVGGGAGGVAAPTLAAVGNAPTATTPGVVGKNLTYAPDATVNGAKVTPARVPLRVVDDNTSGSEAMNKMTVHFESNGPRTYSLSAASVDDALKEVNAVADMLGVEIKVTGVFVHID